ncbi:peptidylprolyl isomerase [Candidatus Parcubacteria bacterium]|nr:peptidylprolyl isomerase [Candidatus Parcubacteria bacterium]
MKPKLKISVPKVRKKNAQPPANRITNENIAEHREEVLGSARKYIYPLRHSKHSLVKISLSLLAVALIVFFSYTALALYKFKSTSDFMYQVTKVVPFPVARIGTDFVSYESYLFEVKHYTHYYSTQADVDFESDRYKQQLADYKKRAQEKVINDAYAKIIAKQKGLTVSEQEVNDEIAVYRNQNRLGSTDDELKAVLHDFWNWSIDDFKRTLRQQLLNEKVVAELDTEAKQKAEDALWQLESGKDFSELAKEVSQDPATKENGGNFGFLIDKNNRDVSPKTVQTLFSLQSGEISKVINIGYGLQIVKNLEQKDDKIKAAHIVFNFKDINDYLGAIKDRRPAVTYATF